MVSVDPFEAKPGDMVTVTGQAWMNGCDDSGGSGGGCASGDDQAEPIENIELRLMGPKTDQRDRMLNSGYLGDTEVDVLLAELGVTDEGKKAASGLWEERCTPDGNLPVPVQEGRERRLE